MGNSRHQTVFIVYFLVQPITEQTAIVTVGKSLDFQNAIDFKNMLQDQVRLGILNFILDFSDTTTLDSSGLGALFTFYRRAIRSKRKILFASATGSVEATIHLTRVYKVFSQFPTVDDAFEAVCEQEKMESRQIN